jgi:hypothetical protein
MTLAWIANGWKKQKNANYLWEKDGIANQIM